MIRFTFGIALLIAISSMAHAQPKVAAPPPKNEYYPLEEGTRWTYLVPVGKDAVKTIEKDPSREITVYVERKEPVRRSKKSANLSEFFDSFIVKTESRSASSSGGGDEKRGKLGVVMVLAEQLLVTEDGVFRMQCAGKDIDPFVKILGAPDQQTWGVASISETVPLKGAFVLERRKAMLDKERDVLVVSCRDMQVGNRAMDADYWFAKDIGIVKQRVEVKEFPKGGDMNRKPAVLEEFSVMTHLKTYQPKSGASIQMPPKDQLDLELPIPADKTTPVVPPPPPLPEKK